MSDRTFLALVGPTAAGKTSLSLELAQALEAEIVSVDSRQVYRGMDIGTAKATAEERARVPHHGLDLVGPDERYSAGRFARDARGWIDDIRARGRLPLLVGGTGFFLRALTRPIFEEPEMDPGRLESLRDWLSAAPRATLERWVERLDPPRAEVAAEGGPQRLGRTLEIALLTGRPLSWWHREAASRHPGRRGLIVVLELPREELDRRIHARVEEMVREGLVAEVRALKAAGYGPDDPGMTGVGYREILRYLDGEWTLDDAMEAMGVATRQYARRQLTWFRNQLPEDDVLRVDGTRPMKELVACIARAWTDSNDDSGRAPTGADEEVEE